MKEAKFIKLNRDKWAQMEHLSNQDADRLAQNFIDLSDDLSYARTFYPGSKTETYLNQLMSAYQLKVNRSRPSKPKWFINFWKRDLPLLMYRERRTMWFSLAFFVISFLIGWFSAWKDVDFVRLILGNAYVDMTIENIEKGTPMGVYDSMKPFEMFLMITLNNIRVAFFAFVFGVIFSVGTLWILFQNGVMLGSFQYFFFYQNLLLHSAMSIWAHGTFEITSIVIAGGAGLIVGNSFLFPGTYSRLYSFRKGAVKGLKIVGGLVPFFIIAGAIESFITRLADSRPFIGLIMIILSIFGVIGYFIIYPYYIHKKLNHENKNSY